MEMKYRQFLISKGVTFLENPADLVDMEPLVLWDHWDQIGTRMAQIVQNGCIQLQNGLGSFKMATTRVKMATVDAEITSDGPGSFRMTVDRQEQIANGV